jgi:hypothetical protein
MGGPFFKYRPAAMANRMIVSGVMGSVFAVPRTPSVPKSFLDTLFSLFRCFSSIGVFRLKNQEYKYIFE